MVGPPGAATLATATNNQGQVYTTVPNRNTGGAYIISNVASGFYTVRFTAAPRFVALSSAMPLVQASQPATAGTTFMTYINAASGIHSLVTWQYEGRLCSHQQLAGSLSADSLRIVALSSTSMAPMSCCE